MSTMTRLMEFRAKLTTLSGGTAPFRVVHSSGGAAGGVVCSASTSPCTWRLALSCCAAALQVSEGMGYGLIVAGIALSTQPTGSPSWRAALSFGEELFAGWRRMCELSRDHCQDDPHLRCGGRLKRDGMQARGFTSCLPSWQFDDALRTQRGSGSATDADEDALLGLVLMVQATSHQSWALWEQTLSWTYETARAFLHYNAAVNGRQRLPKLGSCWGGWDCNNPSYLAPGHYRAFRAFTLQYAPTFGVPEATAQAEAAAWDSLIATSYSMLDDAQCDANGLDRSIEPNATPCQPESLNPLPASPSCVASRPRRPPRVLAGGWQDSCPTGGSRKDHTGQRAPPGVTPRARPLTNSGPRRRGAYGV